jgi:nitronate monooxygenase
MPRIRKPAAPFAVNQIVHMSNKRLEHDLMLCVKYKVPIVISSLGAVPEVNAAVHSYGGIVLHDVINNRHANSAIRKGADGLIAVAAGAGGHAGTLSPFALVQEIREWFDGPLLLAGAIATGGAHPGGAGDGRRHGLYRLALHRHRGGARQRRLQADDRRQHAATSSIPTISPAFTATTSSPRSAAGLDPDTCRKPTLPRWISSRPSAGAKAWKDIWGCGQGIGAVKAVEPVAKLVDRLETEYAGGAQRLAL